MPASCACLTAEEDVGAAVRAADARDSVAHAHRFNFLPKFIAASPHTNVKQSKTRLYFTKAYAHDVYFTPKWIVDLIRS